MAMAFLPLSVAGLVFSLGRYATTLLVIFLEGATMSMGRLMPMISVVGNGASIILHREEKLEPSFLTQSE